MFRRVYTYLPYPVQVVTIPDAGISNHDSDSTTQSLRPAVVLPAASAAETGQLVGPRPACHGASVLRR